MTKYYVKVLILCSLLICITFGEEAVPNEEICYTDHNNLNETTCFVPPSYDSSDTTSIDMDHAPIMLSNITAKSLLSILNTTDNFMFVVFYDNTTLFSTKFIFSFKEAIKKVHKTNFNVLYATIRKQDEYKFSVENNINNDVGLRVFIPGLERLKLQFEYSLRTLSSLLEPQRQEMLTKYEESRPIEARARRAYNMIIAANQMQDQGKLAEAGAK